MEPEIFSSGYLVFRLGRPIQFLLMQHTNRWDLPKGHQDPGETLAATALRELEEETGIRPADVWTDPDFKFESEYMVQVNKRPRLKQLTIYLAWLKKDREVRVSEHLGYRWFDWSPPHTIQAQAIDPLLRDVQNYIARLDAWPPASVLKDL
jgi:bis(5'-nucleosidyl)-tetraphosphatase